MPVRKRYTKEFKLDAVSMMLDQGHKLRSRKNVGSQCAVDRALGDRISAR